MPRKTKLTQDEKFLIDCYNALLRETGEVPTVEEVQARYREKYGNN